MEGIKRRIQLMITRGVVSLVDSASLLQMLQIKTIGAVPLDNVEYFEPYGFTAHAHPGAEVITLSAGGRMGHEVAICVADRQYRLKGLVEGEVALYDDLGHCIMLKRDGMIIDGATHDINIINCPNVIVTEGNVVVNQGNVTVTDGDVIADGISLKNHVHGGVQSGATDTGAPHA